MRFGLKTFPYFPFREAPAGGTLIVVFGKISQNLREIVTGNTTKAQIIRTTTDDSWSLAGRTLTMNRPNATGTRQKPTLHDA